MSIPEAVRLVLQTGAFADNGEIFVLDMGIKGAAWATILGQFISFLICAAYLRHPKTFKMSAASAVPKNLSGPNPVYLCPESMRYLPAIHRQSQSCCAAVYFA